MRTQITLCGFGLGPILFMQSFTNLFDLLIVGLSLIGLIFRDLPGVSVLRLFRLEERERGGE